MTKPMNENRIQHVPFTELLDLASEKVGGQAIFANDDFFAPKEGLLKAEAPVFIPGKYTEFGKWMDGWESRRKRVLPGHDFCILKLGIPGVIRGVNVDTAFFTGNYPEYCSIEAAVAPSDSDAETLQRWAWQEILPKTRLQGDTMNLLPVSSPLRWTHLRLNIFPDGGVARLRVHGEAVPEWEKLKASGEAIDLAAAENGGTVLTSSDAHYGPKDNLIFPGRAQTMGEGWETRRRRGPGFDWIVLKLALPGAVEKIEVDTNHFKGNYPDLCSIEGLVHPKRDLLPTDFRDRADLKWVEILPKTKLQAHHRHFFEKELVQAAKALRLDYVKLNIFPDGGVSRLRVYGRPQA